VKKIFLGFTLGVLLVLGGEAAFVVFGGMPMDTKAKELPLERYLAHRALQASMRGSESIKSPLPSSRENLDLGAKIYSKRCSVCHGERGQPPPPIANGEFPRPPQLLSADESVSDDPVGETFWKVKNGIRLTGMPGFRDTLSEQEIWEVSMFLATPDAESPARK
jgi:thiosulfate dehydrogenase